MRVNDNAGYVSDPSAESETVIVVDTGAKSQFQRLQGSQSLQRILNNNSDCFEVAAQKHRNRRHRPSNSNSNCNGIEMRIYCPGKKRER